MCGGVFGCECCEKLESVRSVTLPCERGLNIVIVYVVVHWNE